MSMLAGKASDRVYRSMMDIEPDTGPSNVRIRASTGPVLESDDGNQPTPPASRKPYQ